MRNPYFINEQAVISFSGGRSSAYMLYKILQAHGGVLPDYLKCVFSNTGMEMLQTLDFVEKCSEMWGVKITWLEYGGKKQPPKVVDHASASRSGEPFSQMIDDKKYLPNMVARFCTSELKVKPILELFPDHAQIVGIRADEPRRVAKQLLKDDYLVPMAEAGVSKQDIHDFWESRNFNLELPMINGASPYSNCTLCFLKGGNQKQSMIREDPKLADWWIKQENKIGARFRSDQPSYERMQVIATDQGSLFELGDDETIPCFCGD